MAPGCTRSRWWGPSDHFRRLDADHDRSLSLDEWRAYYDFDPATHEPDPKRGAAYLEQFARADCDHDARLTWPEYYELRFKLRYCTQPG